MDRTLALALPVVLLALAACSSGPPARSAATTPAEVSSPATDAPSAPPTTSAPPVPSLSPRTSSSPPAGPTPRPVETPLDPLSPRPPKETAPPVGLPTCRSNALTVTDADAKYTADAVQELFTVRTGGPDCQLTGSYPAVQVLDAAGGPAATPRLGGYGLPAPGGAPVTLSRGTSLSFYVATARDAGCPAAATLVVTLPGAGGAVRAATGMTVCGGAVGVGPVQRLGDAEDG